MLPVLLLCGCGRGKESFGLPWAVVFAWLRQCRITAACDCLQILGGDTHCCYCIRGKSRRRRRRRRDACCWWVVACFACLASALLCFVDIRWPDHAVVVFQRCCFQACAPSAVGFGVYRGCGGRVPRACCPGAAGCCRMLSHTGSTSDGPICLPSSKQPPSLEQPLICWRPRAHAHGAGP